MKSFYLKKILTKIQPTKKIVTNSQMALLQAKTIQLTKKYQKKR